MKHYFKKMMALVIAMVMVLGTMTIPAMAAAPTGDGSITINSPIMGASYNGYRIFDVIANENYDSVSYTIKTTSPFYDAISAYVAENAVGEGQLILTPSAADATLINVTEGTGFDPQAFGKYIAAAIADGTIAADDLADYTYTPTYSSGSAVTVGDAAAISFEDLALGYYLITNTYPKPEFNVTLTIPGTTPQTLTFTSASTDSEITAAVNDYVAAVVTDAYVTQYIADNKLKEKKEQNGATWDDNTDFDAVKSELIDNLKADTVNKIKAGIQDATDAANSDYNVAATKLVFVNTTTPDAVINEKNEVEQWDVPVNPDTFATVEGLPDHGNPEGGKNIILTKDGVDYAVDWTEASIGDKVHYQLSINATNFEQIDPDYPETVKQVKEYIIADYENKNMTPVADSEDPEGKLIVRIVKKNQDGTIAGTLKTIDYTAWKAKFFMNDNHEDLSESNKGLWDLDGDDTKNAGGIAIPWVECITVGENADHANGVYTQAEIDAMTNVTKTVEKVLDGEGHEKPIWVKAKDGEAADADGNLLVGGEKVQAVDKDGNLMVETTTHYFHSLYPNDVTILVDYYMELNDTATIDAPGNINTSQFGVNYVEPTDVTYNPPKPDTPEDKTPSEDKEQDTAKVYTYALAIHKVDQNGQSLAGAEFKIQGLTAVNTKSDGWYKVNTYNASAADFTNAVTLKTDKDGMLVVEGFMTSSLLTIRETLAPEGYNILTTDQYCNVQKIGSTVSTSSTVTYKDGDGNITEVITNASVVYKDKNGQTVATKTTGPEGVKYYGADNTVISESNFNNLITKYTGENISDVDASQLSAVELKIENHQGSTLPSTGGIGTTIFYTIGAILVIGAGIVLITRRRMSAQ